MKKYILFVAFILVIGYLLIFTQPKTNFLDKKGEAPTQTSSKQTNKMATSSAQFNLQGPLRCSGDYNGSKYEALILNRNIKAVVAGQKEKLNVLLTNDCLYLWNEGLSRGQKICGVGTYLQIAESMISFGGMNVDSILSFIPKESVYSKSENGTGKTQITGSCVKKDIDKSIFILPPKVVFEAK